MIVVYHRIKENCNWLEKEKHEKNARSRLSYASGLSQKKNLRRDCRRAYKGNRMMRCGAFLFPKDVIMGGIKKPHQLLFIVMLL